MAQMQSNNIFLASMSTPLIGYPDPWYPRCERPSEQGCVWRRGDSEVRAGSSRTSAVATSGRAPGWVRDLGAVAGGTLALHFTPRTSSAQEAADLLQIVTALQDTFLRLVAGLSEPQTAVSSRTLTNPPSSTADWSLGSSSAASYSLASRRSVGAVASPRTATATRARADGCGERPGWVTVEFRSEPYSLRRGSVDGVSCVRMEWAFSLGGVQGPSSN